MTQEEPQFRVVLRGYDQTQVFHAIRELQSALDVCRRTAAERTTALSSAQEELRDLRAELEAVRASTVEHAASGAGSSFEDLGERIGTILSLAGQEAEQVRSAAHAEAYTVREAADTDAMRMRSAAQTSADEIVQRATDEAAARRRQVEVELAEDRERHEQRLTALRAQADELDRVLARTRQDADAERDRILQQARSDAERLRHDTDAELAEATERRDRIHAHLAEVHRTLGDLMAAGRSTGRAGADDPPETSDPPADRPSTFRHSPVREAAGSAPP